MNIEIRHLRAFLAVAGASSFTRASERLALSQPALSALIKQLEALLGVTLFHRTTRMVELTEAGAELLPIAERILSELTTACADLRDLAGRKRGRVVVAALPSMGSSLMPAAMASYRRRNPGIEIVLIDALGEPIVSKVLAGEVDFGVGIGLAGESGLAAAPLFRDHLVLLARSDHPLAAARTVRWPALTRAPVVAMARNTSVRHLVDRAFARNRLVLEPAFEVSHMATAVALVAANLGVSVLPSSALPAFNLSGLVSRRLVGPPVERTIAILTRAGRQLSPAAADFAAQLKRLAAARERSAGIGRRLAAPQG